MKAKLRVVGGRANRQEIELTLPTIVGRAKESGLCVRHPTVSRKHCELREEAGLLVVVDLGSSNGIAVGDQLVPRATLRPGDRLTIGPLTFEAQYQLNGTAHTAPAPTAAGVPPLADTEVESDFDFLSDEAHSLAPPSDGEPRDGAASAESAVSDSVELELDDGFDLQPLDGDIPVANAASAATDEEVPEEFALPDDIPLALDDLELGDAIAGGVEAADLELEDISLEDRASAEPAAERSAGSSGLKLHETLEFDLEEEEPVAVAPEEKKPKATKPIATPPKKAEPQGDGDTLDGLDDWLGLSDE